MKFIAALCALLESLISLLEREGGHIVICLLVLLLCIAITLTTDSKLAGEIGTGAWAALLYCMKGNGNGKAKPGSAGVPAGTAAADVVPKSGGQA